MEFRSSGSSSERRPAAAMEFEKFQSTLSGGGSALAKDFGSMNMDDLPPPVKAGVVPKIHTSATPPALPLQRHATFMVKAGLVREDYIAPPPPMQPRSTGSSSERRPAAATEFEKFQSTLSGGGSALAKDFGSMNMDDLPPPVKAGVVPKIHASAPPQSMLLQRQKKKVTVDECGEEFLVKDSVARKDTFAPPPPMQPRVEIKSMRHNVLEDILLDGRLEPRNIPFAVLQDITENFSDKRSIGSGGFGVVYKGVLQNGSVAVKKLLNSQTIEDGPFYKEANFLMNVKHQNIVRFLGFCAHTENEAMKMERSGRYEKYIYPEKRERLLCFEYISGGSLDNHLADELGGLGWHTRYEIIKGICEGLQYLHKEMSIVHMDLKPPNILLDDLMIPKITDFGVSRHLDGISQAVTKAGIMSLGYSAPEYLLRGEFSVKSDMYSLGVIITELVTGRKAYPDIKTVLRRWRYRWNKSVECPPLGYQQVTKCIEIALSCMSEAPKRRPYICDIVSMLNTMENRNEHITNANEHTVGLISPYPWELLEFDPLELHFPFEVNKQISCSLQLTNDRDDYIAFDVQTRGMLKYLIEPNKGIVPPRSKRNVIITLQPQKRAPDARLCKNEEFDVRCSIVNEDLTTENITEDMFDEKSGRVVDEVNVTVAF